MFEVTVEKHANLLKVAYSGRVDGNEAKLCAERIESLLYGLRPGFRLLSDFRALDTMDLECVPFIKHVMDLCNQGGIALVVRVIPDPRKDIGFNILSLFHYRRGVRIVTCQTLEEAQHALRHNDRPEA